MPKLIYLNREGAVTFSGGWTWTRENKTALDEFHGESGVAGLFTASGWCIVGGQFRRTRRLWAAGLTRCGRIGLILFNSFYGFWQDPDAAEYRR